MDETNQSVPQPWTKVEIIRHLSDINGYKTYLEFVTPTTGLAYANVDRSKFEICHRLMYRCPDGFDDGMGIDFRTPELDISDCVRKIKDQKLLYDVMLIDPWHEYETSYRDLKEAFDLVRVGGSIVVHDCLPPSEEVITPHFIPGGWGGLTYRAYMDFVLSRDDLRYFTVDTDWGCGVIGKLPRETSLKRGFNALVKSMFGGRVADSRTVERDALAESWSKIRDDYVAAFRFLQENKREYLKALTVDEFLRSQSLAARPQ
jgi:hypothetical protein